MTLLFSDVERSTRLLSELGGRYGDLLEDHRRLLREVWSAHHGVEVSTEGDSFFVAFGNPQDALDAAVAAQRALRAAAHPFRVRMGVHTGAPKVHAAERDYWGEDVNLASRVATAAHGGQILLTAATASKVAAPVEDLGTWRLKDFEVPAQLFQAVVDGEGADRFPPPRALDARPSNLPTPENPLIGRDEDLRELVWILKDGNTRLVTLVGLGGTGKTRLALAAGHELLEHFADGVFFADLSGTADPATIPRVVADAIGATGVPVDEAVRRDLARRRMLLIVDNCEHVLAGVDVLAGWIAGAPELRILATSQAPLRLRAERCVHLASLRVPTERATDPETVAETPSVRLFVDRVLAADAGFRLDAANSQAIAEICRRLEGMPMAIELAAARCSVIGPERLAARLRDDLEALAAVARDAPPRQRSMRAALEWSLGVLGEAERTVFAQWGVFAGRPTFEQVEAGCGRDALRAVDVLVEHSLVRRDEDGRLRMPQSVLAHARSLLEASGGAEIMRRRHAEAMAVTAEDQHARFMLDTAAVVAAAVADREDLLAALRWSAKQAPELHARLAGNIVLPRVGMGGINALAPDVELALSRVTEPSRTRVRLLLSQAIIAYGASERVRERAAFEEAVTAAAHLGDAREHALSLAAFAKAVTSGAQPELDAFQLLAAARDVAAGHPDILALLHGLEAEALFVAGDLDAAAAILEDIQEDDNAGHLAAHQAQSFDPDLRFFRGDVLAALDGYVEHARMMRMSGEEINFIWQIESVGMCLMALDHLPEGLRLVGAATAACERLGMTGRPIFFADAVERQLAAARGRLGDAEVASELSAGGRLDWDIVMGIALRAPTLAREAPV